MKTCPKCNRELKDEAKFCGGCGYKFPMSAAPAVPTSSGTTCPKCGNLLKPGAKFCGKCGTKLSDAGAVPQSKQLEAVGNNGYIRWTMQPGQVAVKISEDEVAACGNVRGIVIQEGTKALVFLNGKIAAEVEAGSYAIEGHEPTSQTRTGGLVGFLKTSCTRAWQAIVGAPVKPSVAIVLVRSTEFPLLFAFQGANTAGIRSDVALHILCKVTNINSFYQNMLLDRSFVSFEALQKDLQLVVQNEVNQAVQSLSPDHVGNNPALVGTLQNQLASAVQSVYPFIAISRVIQVTAENQAIAHIRKMSEELYVSEQELAHLQKRNDFLNRLQATKNAQELAEIRAKNGQEVDKGQIEADFKAKKLEIYKQMALTQDEQDKFDLMLSAEKQLREAKTQEQIDAAMHEYEKSGMLRDQEIDQLRHKGAMADLRNSQEYDMAELKGELALKREQDAYTDERRDKDAAFHDSRRRAEMQLDREEQQNQLDMLRQAQAIRMERENAEHQRKLEAENAARAHEQAMQQAQLDAKLENQRIYAGMSFEQIMAANPDISPEAAKALAQKFSSESKDELLRAREADMARQNAQQMEMMRMMQQMAMAGMGVNQQHQQQMMAAKQAELDRVRDDANRNEDRMLAGVQSTVTAAGVAFSGKAQGSAGRPVRKEYEESMPAQTPKVMSPAVAKCSNCGAELEPGSSFCGECGTAI